MLAAAYGKGLMSDKKITIALASLKHPKSIAEGLQKVDTALKYAAARDVKIICFSETYLPGLRGSNPSLPPPDRKLQSHALKTVRGMAHDHGVATIIGMESSTDKGLLNLAYVISAKGRVLGHQTKNQITPGGESRNYVPDSKRRVFTVNGVKFGIVICHEGWRYPETVRWAACRGAQIVFHPQVTGKDHTGKRIKKWGEVFYEKAMLCRAEENAIYFASVNNAMRYQNSATSLIGPDGKRIAYVPYAKEKVLVRTIDLSKATRRYANRYNPQWYPK
jgi:predicted amidohydrolase